MARIFIIASLLLTLTTYVQSVPAPRQRLVARRLLGSSFGVPGNQSFDYVIVGGGNGGLTIAARLAENPSNHVAIVEAGSFYEIDNGNLSQVPAYDLYFAGESLNDTNPSIDWGFVTTPQPGAFNASTHYPRGKCLGGSSARNYMTYHTGTTGSYQMWADMVGDQSYTFDNLLPYFKKSMNFTPPDSSKRAANATPDYDPETLGKGGPLFVTFPNYAAAFGTWIQKGLEEIGIFPIKGFTSGKLLGSSYILSTIDASTQTRDSSETAFLRPALKERPNLLVYQSTMGKRIRFDGNKTAIGVEVNTNGKMYTLLANKEVILSAGAFQSPQLLMVSGVGPATTLQRHNITVIAERPGVGQNMWDHILFGPSYRVNVITGSSLGNPQYSAEAIERFNSNQTGHLTNPGVDVIAWEKIPDPLRSSFSQVATTDLSQFSEDWPEIEYINANGYFGYQQNFIQGGPNDGYNYATVAIALVAPLSRGTVDITSADASDLPLINPNWLTHPTDQAVAVAGYKRARQLFETAAMQPILIGPEYFPGTANVQTDEEILDIIRKSFGTVFHASATCAMGCVEDQNAVVDSKARVIGVHRLRVVDASAFPFLPPGHPMATVYALAEKIADEIKAGN